MIARSIQDPKIRDAGIKVRTGRKWKAKEAVRGAESRLQHQDIVGTVAQGRLGLGCVTRTSCRTASVEERSRLVQKEMRQQEEETRQAQADRWRLAPLGGSPGADLKQDMKDGGTANPVSPKICE